MDKVIPVVVDTTTASPRSREYQILRTLRHISTICRDYSL